MTNWELISTGISISNRWPVVKRFDTHVFILQQSVRENDSRDRDKKGPGSRDPWVTFPPDEDLSLSSDFGIHSVLMSPLNQIFYEFFFKHDFWEFFTFEDYRVLTHVTTNVCFVFLNPRQSRPLMTVETEGFWGEEDCSVPVRDTMYRTLFTSSPSGQFVTSWNREDKFWDSIFDKVMGPYTRTMESVEMTKWWDPILEPWKV